MWYIVRNYIERHFQDSVFLFTDGSKDPKTGYAGAAVYIPMNDSYIKKRVSNHLSVYATELLAILMALQWTEEKRMNIIVIASDSYSALESIKSGRSSFRMDIINEIFHKLYNISLWVY